MKKKLIRDNYINEISTDRLYAITSPDEYKHYLRLKLQEEVDELIEATHGRGDLLNELADVLEVVEAITLRYNFSMAEVLQCKQFKKDVKGGFTTGLLLGDV